MDYDLGQYNGLEMIRKANASNYDVPIILFTGWGSYELDMQAIEAGESLYLTKSEINPLLLERGIRYAIERKQIEQALAAAYEALAEANALFIQVETGAGPPIARASQAGFFPFAESQPHS